MAIWPTLTFCCRFEVTVGAENCGGEGRGFDAFGNREGVAGPNPRFELRAGWLTMFPSEGWIKPLALYEFSDDTRSKPALPDFASWWKRQREPPDSIAMAREKAEMEERLNYNRATRNLTSYSLFVGGALQHVLQTGDQLTFAYDGFEGFQYFVERSMETVFAAGPVPGIDAGKTVAVWQETDDPTLMKVRRPYISVRIGNRTFQLIDGQEAHSDPYYVFVARSNNHVPEGFFLGHVPRAIHAAGSLRYLPRELIADAAQQLTKPKIRIL
jgi:hypothetical protein